MFTMEFKVLWMLFLMTCFVLILSEKITKSSRHREARFFSFDTSVDGDIAVDLDFTIPFVKIPIKKTMESAFGSDIGFPTINVNIIGLVLGVVGIFGTAFLLPLLTKSHSVTDPNIRYGKFLADEFNIGNIVRFGGDILSNLNYTQGCTEKLACLAAQDKSSPNSLHILRRISRNALLADIMNTTAIDAAIQKGWEGRHCENACWLNDEQLHNLLKKLHNTTCDSPSSCWQVAIWESMNRADKLECTYPHLWPAKECPDRECSTLVGQREYSDLPGHSWVGIILVANGLRVKSKDVALLSKL